MITIERAEYIKLNMRFASGRCICACYGPRKCKRNCSRVGVYRDIYDGWRDVMKNRDKEDGRDECGGGC